MQLPPFLQPTSKYHFYFQWMTERIAEKHPQLDSRQVDSLLLMDASQLDIMLSSDNVNADTVLEMAETGIPYSRFQALTSNASCDLLLEE